MSERPRPEPLAPPAPVKRPVRRVTLLAALGALVLCGACVGGTYGLLRASLPLVSGERRSPVWDAVVFGAGRYMAVECAPETGASVYVVDLETGDQKPAVGFELLAAEPHAPVLWLTKSSSDGSRPGEGSIQGGGADAPPEQLMVWHVDTENAPRLPASGGWTPWPGDGGHSAFAEVDTGRGAWPAGLSFRRLDGSGRSAPASLPDGFGTFEPLGWSPSGRYFAVRELRDPLGAASSGRGRVVVFDAADGSAVASYASATAYVAGSAWHVDADELGVVAVGKAAAGVADSWRVEVTTLSAERAPTPMVSGSVPAAGLVGWRVAGTSDGLVFSVRGAGLWRVADGSLQPVSAGTAAGGWCVGVLPDGDTLWHEPSPVSDRIVRTSADGSGEPVAVWTEEDTRRWRWPPE